MLTPARAASANAVIEQTVSGLGYDLLDIERLARGLMRVTIDRRPGAVYPGDPGEFVTVDDCERVTRQLQYVAEVEGVAYARLEVSSPGLDRPLKREADFERFVGHEVAIALKLPFQGRKHWKGMLARAADLARPPAAGGQAQVMAEGGAAAPASGWCLVVGPQREKPAPGKPAAGSKPKAKAGRQDTDTGPAEQVLGFALDELREARLVPVVDFKGRRGASNTAPELQKDDGGQER